MTEMNGAPGNVAQSDLPSSRSLLRSTAIAVVVAIVLLVTIVLPAEYGVDPTRIGRLLGLTQMGEIKVTLANEAAADAAADAAAANATDPVEGTPEPAVEPPRAAVVAATPAPSGASDTAANQRETTVTLQPGEGKEVKLVMRKGARATYQWATDGGAINFLTHGDTANAPANSYHTYGRGTGARTDDGTIVAAFDGMHGWFWRNRTNTAIKVTLRTSGDYQEIKQPK